MHLPRLLIAIAFPVAISGSTASAQSAPTPLPPTDIRPLVTVSIGPALLKSNRFNNGGNHPAVDAALGARKRVAGMFGIVVTANAGTMLETVIGGEYTTCRSRLDGRPGCYPNTPVSSWFGMTAGGEAYLGRTILGVQMGPVAVSAPKYERDLVPGSPARAWGLRTQFEANVPVYRRLGITLSAVDRYVPKILDDKWHISSFSFGLSIR